MPKAEGGPCLLALSGRRQPTPPLSLRDISPRKGGGEGNQRICIRLCKGERGTTMRVAWARYAYLNGL